MLDPWIIEEIRRREDEHRRDQEAGRVELPVESPQYQERGVPTPVTPGTETGETDERGVTIIDM
jgi:hypothetical protein